MFVITGGGSGLGRALALALAKRNKTVIIIGRREECLQETAQHSTMIKYLQADVATESGIDKVCSHLKSYSTIKALINNAGTLNPIGPLCELTHQEWQQAMRTNVDAPLFLTQKLQAQLSGGRVLNISSGAAYFPIKGWAAYCVTKAALAMLTRCCQLESEAVSFASVKPGIADTDMQAIARLGRHMDPEHVAFYQNLKRKNLLVSPETIAEFLCWLLIDLGKSTFVTQEWDIYDKTHHASWLKAPHKVQHWED